MGQKGCMFTYSTDRILPIGTTQFEQAPRPSPGVLAGRDLFKCHAVLSPPIWMLKGSRGDVDLIGFAEQVIELGDDHRRPAAGQELVSGNDKLLGREITIGRKKPLLAECLEDRCAVLLATLPLRGGLIVARIKAEALLQVDVAAVASEN